MAHVRVWKVSLSGVTPVRIHSGGLEWSAPSLGSSTAGPLHSGWPFPSGVRISFPSESCVSSEDHKKANPPEVCVCQPVVETCLSRSKPDTWGPGMNPGKMPLWGCFAGLLGQKIHLPSALKKHSCPACSFKASPWFMKSTVLFSLRSFVHWTSTSSLSK